ncbi:hypothetical protein Ae505Ps2_3007 [Pseudonocardia sp. Ae505_Ps2]|nr:hypothetical protein Ae505Ps2_3007 [Pseudonocardia sp. Ae505_Ps2]
MPYPAPDPSPVATTASDRGRTPDPARHSPHRTTRCPDFFP